MSKQFNSLTVKKKVQETEDSCSFVFTVPESLKDNYAFKAGQYLTLKVAIGGKEHRRAYSIYTVPADEDLGVTVKRVKGGLVSNYLIDKVNEGDAIAVMPPEGKFVAKPGQEKQRDHYFFAGGSGITPVRSMIMNILEEEPLSTCYLLYANRTEDSIIFKKTFDDLLLRYEDQFYLDYIISQPVQTKAGGLSGLFGKKAAPTWRGLKGRINPAILERYLEEHPSKTGKDVFYLCGPGGMIESIENWLKGKGTESVQIKKEYFTNADVTTGATESVAMTAGAGRCEAKVKLNGEHFTIEIPAGKTVLDALVDEGKDPPYSCTSGACSTCVAKVLDGKVEMEACFALDDEEIEDGYVLTCQAQCTTATLSIDYDS